MKQNVSFEKQQLIFNTKVEDSLSQNIDKISDVIQLKKQLAEITESNRQKQETYSLLEKELKHFELDQHKLQALILKSQLELENVKFDNLEKKHKWEEEKQQEEEQNEMDMNKWLGEVQKFNGLSQEAIDSLVSMEYEGNPLDSDICLSCYKQMQSGQMAKYLPCAHLFHVKCVDEHLKLSKVCPACMQEVIL